MPLNGSGFHPVGYPACHEIKAVAVTRHKERFWSDSPKDQPQILLPSHHKAPQGEEKRPPLRRGGE